MTDLIPDPQTGQFLLAAVPPGSQRLLLQAAARLAGRGPLRVLDCGNCFNVYVVTMALRQYSLQVEETLRRIQVARAFTCYQVETLLQTASFIPTPTLVLDLLATFRDESVPMTERRRLLGVCLPYLRRLARGAPLLVSAVPVHAGLPDDLLSLLEEAADVIWRFAPPPPVLPMRLL